MKDYCISVTYKCNWSCDYCCVDTHSRADPTDEQVMKNAELIEPGAHVSLSGGEPGLMSEQLLVKLLDLLESKNCVIGVNTNGMFFKNFPQYLHRINDFRYHCSPDLRNKVWLPPEYKLLNIKFVIVVTDESYSRFEEFITKNSKIKFTVYFADKSIVNGNWGTTLSPKNRIDLYMKYKHLITPESVTHLFSNKDQALVRLSNL